MKHLFLQKMSFINAILCSFSLLAVSCNDNLKEFSESSPMVDVAAIQEDYIAKLSPSLQEERRQALILAEHVHLDTISKTYYLDVSEKNADELCVTKEKILKTIKEIDAANELIRKAINNCDSMLVDGKDSSVSIYELSNTNQTSDMQGGTATWRVKYSN